ERTGRTARAWPDGSGGPTIRRVSNDLAWMDATAQAELVRTGKASPTELVDAAIARIEKVDPELHSVIHERFEKARKESSHPLPEGPFTGVPFVIKDLYAPTAGDPMHNGNRSLKEANYIAPEDSWLTGRYRAAGF